MNALALAKGDDGGGGFYDSSANIKDDAAVDNVYSDADGVTEVANGDGGGTEDGDDEDEDCNMGNDVLMLLSGE